MFGNNDTDTKKTDEKAENKAAAPANPTPANPTPTKPVIPPRPALSPLQPKPAFKSGGFKPASPTNSDAKTLIVGSEISFSGDIASCDRLQVEGTIEATLADSRYVSVTSEGLFKGKATVDDMEIAGSFEGELTVKGTLTIREGGRVSGTIKYGVLEVSPGGVLSGSVEPLDN